MRQVYLEPLGVPFTAQGKTQYEATQDRIRDAVQRVLERAAVEISAPTQLVSVSLVGTDTDTPGVLVVVEETATGFRPIGT
jgi:hypothetical protein